MLNREKFQSEIRKLNDVTYDDFVGFPESCSLASSKWAHCLFLYAEQIIPSSSTLVVAEGASQQIFLGLCSSNTFDQGVSIFTNAIMIFAQTMITGFTSSGFTGVMPVKPLNLKPIFLKALDGGSALDFANELSTEIDNWFKSGTAININSGVIINWK